MATATKAFPGRDNLPSSGARRRFQWPRIFGYDFFISFKLGPPPIGAQSYASDLARRLRERDFTVFFSEEEAPPGEQLDGTLVRALRRSMVLVVVVNEGALIQSTWVRKEVEEFRRLHPSRLVVPVVVDRALDKFGLLGEASAWLHNDGRIWLDETPAALQQGIASDRVVDRLSVSHRFIRANSFFRYTVAAIMLALIGLASYAAYQAWAATQRFREASALRLAAEGAAMTTGERTGGSLRGLLQVLAAGQIVPSAATDEALQAEFVKFQRHIVIRQSAHPIDSLSFSDDGRVIASGSHDGYVQLWDAETATPIGDAWAARGPISSLAFDPQSGRIITGTPAGMLQMWDSTTRHLLPNDPAVPAPLFNWTVLVSRDGTRFAWGLENGEVVVWNVAEARQVAHIVPPVPIGGPLGLDFSTDGRHMAFYSDTGNVGVFDTLPATALAGQLLWKADTGAHEQGFNPMMDFGVRSGVVAFSPDGTRLASGSTAGLLQWWDAASGQPIAAPVDAHDGGVTALAFSPDGKTLVSGGNDKSVKTWSADTFAILNKGDAAHTGPVTAIAFGRDSGRFASASLDGTLRLWRVGDSVPGMQLPSEMDSVTAIAFGPDGRPVITGAEIRNMSRSQNIFARSPTGSRHVIRADNRELWLAETATGKTITLLADGKVPVQNVMFSPNGALLIAVGNEGVVLLWDAQTGRPMTPIHADSPGVAGLAVSMDGSLIATGGHGTTIRLWSSATGTPVGPAIPAHTGVLGVAFSPDGKRLVSSGGDGMLNIWDVASGTLLAGPMIGHESGAGSVAFSPDGARIVSAGAFRNRPQGEQARLDYSLRLWDAATGRPIGRPLPAQDAQIVAFSRDGKRVVSTVINSGTTYVWDVFAGWADALCAKLPRNPSEAEWREWVSPNIDYVCPCPRVQGPAACNAGR